MPEKDRKIIAGLKALLPQLSDRDKDVLLAYGEGMAYKAHQTYTRDSAPRQEARA